MKTNAGTLNGTDLKNFAIVTESEVFGYPARALADYIASRRHVMLPVCPAGEQTAEHFIFLGTNGREYGDFESEIYALNGNIYLGCKTLSSGEQAVNTFIARYLQCGDINAPIPEGEAVYHTDVPDWSEIPSDFTVRELIVRSSKKIQQYLEYDHSLGLFYSYQHKGYKSSLAEARASGIRTTNCVILMNWVLKDAGLYSGGIINHKYDGTCGYTSYSEATDAISKYFDIIPVSERSVSQLAGEGSLLPGDVIFFTDHNQIIIDNDRAMDGGRGNCEKVEVGSTFRLFLGKNPYPSSKPGLIFRAKGGMTLKDVKTCVPDF